MKMTEKWTKGETLKIIDVSIGDRLPLGSEGMSLFATVIGKVITTKADKHCSVTMVKLRVQGKGKARWLIETSHNIEMHGVQHPVAVSTTSITSTDRLLHILWTKAVGTPGYVKAEWKQLETILNRAEKR